VGEGSLSRQSTASRLSIGSLGGDEALQDKLRAMEAEVARMKEDQLLLNAGASSEETEELQVKISALEKTLVLRDDELVKMRDEAQALEAKKLEGLSGDAKAEMQSYQAKVHALEAAAAAKADDAAKLEAEKQALTVAEAKVKGAMEMLQATSAEERKKNEGRIKKLRSELKDAKKSGGGAKVDPKQAKKDALLVKGLASKNDSLKSAVDKAQNEIEKLKEKLAARPAVSGADKMKMDKEKEKAEKKMKLLQETQQRDSKKLDEATTKIAEFEKETAKLARDLEEMKKAAGSAQELQEKAKLAEEAQKAAESELKALKKESEEMADKLKEETKKRKKYYNTIEEMKGNVRVYCRARPISKSELARGNTDCIEALDEYSIVVDRGGSFEKSEFLFDRVYMPANSQEEVYEDTGNLINSALDGYNVCIFAYGQTGSGKTYTMIGDNNRPMQSPGIAPRAFQDIYTKIDELGKGYEVNVEVYMVELYCGELLDLLAPKRNSKDSSKQLKIRKRKDGMVYIDGLTYKNSKSGDELYELFEEGSKSRHVASTKMNAESSRSHLVIGIVISVKNTITGVVNNGKLSLVDLAGSERLGKTGATGQVAKEGASINKSLSALAEVINALSTNNPHVPFRNSILTQLMQDSLGGNAKTLMFVNISPVDYNAPETVNALKYAQRAKMIQNKADKSSDSAEVAKLKEIIRKLKAGEDVGEEDEAMDLAKEDDYNGDTNDGDPVPE